MLLLLTGGGFVEPQKRNERKRNGGKREGKKKEVIKGKIKAAKDK